MNVLRRLFASTPAPQQRYQPACAVCGQPSADIALTKTSTGFRLTYSGPGGSNGGGDPIAAERVAAIHAAFSEPYVPTRIAAAGLYDDAGFCMECTAFYCSAHWQITTSGGGYCPAGHFKSLDPHWSPEE